MSSLSPIVAVHREPVAAPATGLWSHMVDKVRRPDKYVPGVTNVEVIQEHGPHTIERKMTLPTGAVVHEIIHADPTTMHVVFKAMPDDANVTGYVTNTVYVDAAGAVSLEYAMVWTPKPGREAFTDKIRASAQAMITGAVQKAKQMAEQPPSA